jgi:hypothetical protein
MVIELMLFVAAIIIAIRSLKEAEKARRDTFLPIIVAPEDFQYVIGPNLAHGAIHLRNFGHGIAFDAQAELTGIEKPYLQKVMEISDKIDKYTWTFGLQNTDLYTKKLDQIKLIIKYTDVFNREVTTEYIVTQEKKPDGKYQPHIDWQSQKIILP